MVLDLKSVRCPLCPGRQNMSIQEWQGLAAGWDDSPYGSGPVPHSRYVMIGGGEFSFDPSLTSSVTDN